MVSSGFAIITFACVVDINGCIDALHEAICLSPLRTSSCSFCTFISFPFPLTKQIMIFSHLMKPRWPCLSFFNLKRTMSFWAKLLSKPTQSSEWGHRFQGDVDFAALLCLSPLLYVMKKFTTHETSTPILPIYVTMILGNPTNNNIPMNKKVSKVVCVATTHATLWQ